VQPHWDSEKLDQALVGSLIFSLLIVSPRSVQAVKEVFALLRFSMLPYSLSGHAPGTLLHVMAHLSSFSTMSYG